MVTPSNSRLTSRSVRSFVIRNGRMTSGQKTALDALYPLYGIDFQESELDLSQIFGNSAPIWLEIGFGDGEALLTMAEQNPQNNFLGIEVHAPGVGHLLAGMEKKHLSNIRVMRHDAAEVLQYCIPTASLQRVLLFFPDPWHKKKHHKRRFLQHETLHLIKRALTLHGILHCATDWTDYAESMMELLSADAMLSNASPTGGYSEKPEYRPETKFEQRGMRLGHPVYDLLFEKHEHLPHRSPV